MKLRVINDRILVKMLEEETITPGGIILIEKENTKQYIKGIIEELGKGKRFANKYFPFVVEIGMEVLIAKNQGDLIEIDGEKYAIIRESDILAYVQDNDLVPIADVLLCEKTKDLQQLKSGLIISSRGIRQDSAIVLKKGQGVIDSYGNYNDLGISVGDKVLFDSNRGITLYWNNKEYFVLGMTTVLASSDSDEEIIKDNSIF